MNGIIEHYDWEYTHLVIRRRPDGTRHCVAKEYHNGLEYYKEELRRTNILIHRQTNSVTRRYLRESRKHLLKEYNLTG